MMRFVVAGGKGGVTKSTIARALSVRCARKGKKVMAFDLDSDQATFTRWNNRRAELIDVPQIEVKQVTTSLALRSELNKTKADVIVIDTGAYWYKESAKIISVADCIIMPTRYSLDDVDALITLANELVSKGIRKDKIIIVFSSVLESPTEDRELREFLEKKGFWAAPGFIPFSKSAGQYQDMGYGLTENKYVGPRTAARWVIDAIIQRAHEVVNG